MDDKKEVNKKVDFKKKKSETDLSIKNLSGEFKDIRKREFLRKVFVGGVLGTGALVLNSAPLVSGLKNINLGGVDVLSSGNAQALGTGDSPSFAGVISNSIQPASGQNLVLKEDGGTAALMVDTNGKVGIGTTSPVAKLQVETLTGTDVESEVVNFYNTYSVNEATDTRIRFYATNSNTNVDNRKARIQVTDQGGIGRALLLNSEGGNVGIGTINPSEKLYVNGNLKIYQQLIGGIGAWTTGGTTDWNHSSNARGGSGYTLLLGSANNGPGGSYYYHSFCYAYGAGGNMTQIAIPYTGTMQQYIRYRYSGSWSSWTAI